MKKVLFACLVLLLVGLIPDAAAQSDTDVRFVHALPSACSPTARRQVLWYLYTDTNRGLYYCSAANTFSLVGDTATPPPGSVLRLYDPTYSSIFSPSTTRFSVGSTSAQVIPTTNHFTGVDFYAIANMAGSSNKVAFALSNQWAISGNASSSSMYGIWNQWRESTGFSGSMSNGIGIFNRFTPNQGSLTGELVGVDSLVGAGGSGFSTSADNSNIYAIYGRTVHGYHITANRVAGVRALTQGANASSGATVTHLIGLDVRHWGGSGTAANNTVTNRYGVYIGNYSTSNYLVTNNYGIYLDSTIDELGSGSKYAIYSQSVSPTFLSGSLTFDATHTTAGTTGDQTVNKPAFSVNFAAAASSLTVTNSFVSASSMLLCTVQTNDTTMKSVAAVAGSGSVVLHPNAAPTAETRVYCEVRD